MQPPLALHLPIFFCFIAVSSNFHSLIVSAARAQFKSIGKVLKSVLSIIPTNIIEQKIYTIFFNLKIDPVPVK